MCLLIMIIARVEVVFCTNSGSLYFKFCIISRAAYYMCRLFFLFNCCFLMLASVSTSQALFFFFFYFQQAEQLMAAAVKQSTGLIDCKVNQNSFHFYRRFAAIVDQRIDEIGQ